MSQMHCFVAFIYRIQFHYTLSEPFRMWNVKMMVHDDVHRISLGANKVCGMHDNYGQQLELFNIYITVWCRCNFL